jgi:mRNA-degrading endonuclease RelE of RelBE toxin-antitoxin system
MKFKIEWTKIAKNDIKNLNNKISDSKIDAIYFAAEKIIFPEQFEIDEYRTDCRRIIVGNFKILYQFSNETNRIIKVFNSLHDPKNSKS